MSECSLAQSFLTEWVALMQYARIYIVLAESSQFSQYLDYLDITLYNRNFKSIDINIEINGVISFELSSCRWKFSLKGKLTMIIDIFGCRSRWKLNVLQFDDMNNTFTGSTGLDY